MNQTSQIICYHQNLQKKTHQQCQETKRDREVLQLTKNPSMFIHSLCTDFR